MNNASTVKSEVQLVYPNAGVRFVVEMGSAQGGGGVLRICAKDASGERDLAFTDECSSILGDFIGGFVRWLGTIGIAAKHEEGEINGSFGAAYDAHKLIQASAAICDMIEQRFCLYPYNIVG